MFSMEMLDIGNTYQRGQCCLLDCNNNHIYNQTEPYDTWYFNSSFKLGPAGLVSRPSHFTPCSFMNRVMEGF